MNFHKQPHIFVSQVHLKVQDLERSITFYKEMIGFQVLSQEERKAKLTADGKNVLLYIEQPDDVVPKQQRSTGLYHFALLLPKRSDLALVVKHLSEKNYPIGSSDHLVSEAIYLSDPDGNGIEIYVDRSPETWEWKDNEVKMTVDPLNLSKLLNEIEEGDTWEGLPSETLIGHIHLHVAELPDTEAFYRELGFDVVCRFGKQALFMSTGGYHHHIGLNTWAGVGASAPAEKNVGMKQFTLDYPNYEKREIIMNNLKKIGAPLIEENGSIKTKDPSGNLIELYVNDAFTK
ncbi:VOC family protein [Bacillus shivajii]|uniref:VOC family protein n=1 Tax=Bacillus shivajii TaxID=1983719 RepID=UPI001CFAC636|nr:VOC family protein [Bacillus shivajii]UCZ54081.1 VOC family protein [Bacillus shivajii]